MSSKRALHEAIDKLSESECAKLLLLIETWQVSAGLAIQRLAENPTFRVPNQPFPVFHPVSPVQGTGIK